MKLDIELENGETLIFKDQFGHDKRPKLFAVTDRAIFVTREQHFAMESFFVDRIPIETVISVSLQPLRSIALWGVSSAIFLGGLVLEAGILWNVYRELPGTKVSPWPIAFMLIGAAMLIFGRGRKILTVYSNRKPFRWKPGFLDDKQKIKAIQEGFVEACRLARIKLT